LARLSNDQPDRASATAGDHRLRGETYKLGEAYAFGVIWSFAFKGLAMLVLRFRENRLASEGPFHIKLGGKRTPYRLGVHRRGAVFVAGINRLQGSSDRSGG